MERDFDDMLAQTIVVSTVATLGVGGAPTFSTSGSTYNARVVNVNKLMHDSRGNTQVAGYVAWVSSTATFALSSKYTLPDGSTPPLLMVQQWPDELGSHHTKLTFGRG